ncbi:uncharacterized protein F4812DRAFT_419329 [Daldinia caldariorum]|uniref:uncharacterized protein n=1 Tax=Daldinia caldariorum TaxID=326644 RepID=UPI002007C62F|nr:uncharacterized protein F4812DRAFT_419329 [Daldinia caldariorum]KAI1470878.1 hypothetical protein F4812DRAFT_419329 [Daldinia caldariorum]
MNRTRPARSKTGCSSCRRRKVRCDEAKPICNACTRLSLPCSYEPNRANSTDTLRYRVRFVNSRYSRSRVEDKPTSSEGSRQSVSQQSVAPEVKPKQKQKAPKDNDTEEDTQANPGENTRENTGNNVEPISGVNRPDHSTTLPHLSPVQIPPTGPPSQYSAETRVVPEPVIVNTISQLDVYEAHPQINPGYVPAFFDLNMNFDLLGEEWLVPTNTPGNTMLSSEPDSGPYQAEVPGPITGISSIPSTSNTHDVTVVIGPDDHSLIQHYMSVMTGFSKIRSTEGENLYNHIFTSMALLYAPLFNTIMAWTALHLGQTRPDPDLVRKAEERYSLAISMLHQDPTVAIQFERSIVTIWFALQFELLAARDVIGFCQHLDFIADLVDAHRRHLKASGEATPLGYIGSRMLVWLGAYDARGAWIGGTGRLLENLESFFADYNFIDAAFPNLPASTEDLKPSLRLSLELDFLDSRIVQLHRRKGPAPVAMWSQVQLGLLTLRERFNRDPSVAPIISYINEPSRALAGQITTKSFNCLVLLAAYYSVVINYHREVPAAVSTNLQNQLTPADLAATYIVRLASLVGRLRPPSPQNIWPRLLFLAGIETMDIAYQDWVVKTLMEAEVWGDNFRRTRLLLEQVIKIQSTKGVRVNYVDVMKQHSGLFII